MEHRAREQALGDLAWLEAQLALADLKVEALRERVAAMVKRELERKHGMSRLLQALRAAEVSSAARAGTLRRLHAALELAQRTAARVQTIYFQKQIGSLQRQLEVALKQRRPGRA